MRDESTPQGLRKAGLCAQLRDHRRSHPSSFPSSHFSTDAVKSQVMEEARMDPSELNLQANPAENQDNWIPGMSVGRGTPNIPGNRPLFLGVGAPNVGWQNLAGTAIAGGSNPITRSAVFSGCSTSMLNAMHESSTLRATLSGSMSRASEQHVGPSVRPSCNLPAGCTQVPISILVFHRRLTGRESRPQLPLSHTFMPAPALPDVSEDSKNGASTQVAQSDFLSLGRESNSVASDMAMNPTAVVTPDKYNSEHSPVHFKPNGLDAEASKIEIQGEDSQQSEAAAVICDSHSKLESAIPANTDETQGQHPEESTGLLAEGSTNDNMHEYQRMQKRPKIQINQSDHTDLSTPVVFKERTLTQIEMQISGAEKIETFNNEKEETPARKAKPRRKKHRPKVICEDKPAKKQKPAIMMPEAKPPSQKAKRSYVRKKRNLSSPEKCLGSVSDQSISVETGNADRSRSASVRRRLQLELEEQGVQGDQSSMGNSWHHKQEKLVHAKSSLCSVTKSTVQIGHGLQVDMENSPGGLALDMSFKLNKVLDEYIHLPEVTPKPTQEDSPATSGSFSRELARKQDGGSTHDADAAIMSGLCIEERRGVTVMEENIKDLEMNYSSIDGFEMYCSAASLSEIKSTKSQMSKVSKVEKKNHAQHNNSESSLTGTRDSIILRTAAEMLAFCQAGGIKKKRSVRVRRNSFVPIMGIERNTSQASTKLPQSCMEALNESSCIKFMTKKRSEKALLNSPSSIQPNMDQKNMFSSGSIFCGGSNVSKGSEGIFQQTLPQSPDNKRMDLDIYCEVPERSSANTSTVPYLDYLQGVASKLKYLDLNTEHVHRTEMHSSLTTSSVVSFGGTGGLSNALVPYGGGMIFPYERPLHLVKKQRPRAKVNLDFETTRVWNLLMGKAADPVDGTDVDKERWWQQEREVFQGRANSFIARMRLVQGDRRFSPWKGSVVDSVVGVFLTQNVADHLSSSAYMALAASFPPGSVNNNCKDGITTQENEEIISMSAVGDKNMFDFFGHGARPDLGVNFEELSITYEKIHMETKGNSSAYELTKGDNYSLHSKASNGSFFNHQGTEIDHKAQQLTASTKSTQEIQFQKEMSSAQSVITSEIILQSRLSLNSGIDYAPRKFVGGFGVAASQQRGSCFDDGNSLAGNDATTNEIECQIIRTAAINDDGVGDHGMPSSSMMYPFISTIDRRQLDVRNEPCVASTSPNSSSGSASPHLKNYTMEKKISLVMPFDTHAAQRNGNKTVDTTLNTPKTSTELQVQLHYDKSTSFEASDLQEHELFSATGEMIAETASKADESALKSGFTSYGVPDTAAKASRPKKTRTTSKKNTENFDWDKLRRQSCNNSHMKERIFERRDSVDWEAVRCADVQRISHAIRERGMNNVLAERIQNFLNRLVRDHGSIDLEWLRDIPPDSAKDYLLSIRGLGLKSVECVRLLTLHHLAFPVDTNVGRICVRLGWVPIQPLPESLQLHLLELYPVLETIQKYLWPRLCKLDQQTLYELHYQMITFGKVFCTKNKPNCNACPMRSECKHFASAFASARLALPAPQEKSLVKSINHFGFQNGSMPTSNSTPLSRLEGSAYARDLLANNSQPIIEEPASPREEEFPETLENDIEDFDEDTGEIPTIKLNMEAFAQNLENCIKESNKDIQSDDIAKAMVAISTEAASIPVPKLKNVHRLRTEHYVYELPDSHPLVQQLGLDQREPDDPSPYLLTIWMPDEIKEMSNPPESCCNSQMEGGLCNNEMCHYCMPERENQSRYVRGTILVPCRTAMRGSFPLNGTYFQVNEVFADHKSSHNPIHVARAQLWNLQRRMVYFGTSVPTIFKGLTTEEIQHCFWRGFVCVRGFDMETRAPRPLCPHLHLAASKLPKSRKTSATDQRL